MTHNTQIIKTPDRNFETILNVGRTNGGDIYIDVRIYNKGDIVDVGDVTITQAEWDEINTNLTQNNVKLFVCPECGDIVSQEDILEDLTSGGYGMCMCKFGNSKRVLVKYDPYTEDIKITPNEARLMRIIRSISG